MKLRCVDYETRHGVNELTEVNARFVIAISPRDIEQIAEAMKSLHLYLCGDIELVKATPDKKRCFYCACLNEEESNQCSQCGASF